MNFSSKIIQIFLVLGFIIFANADESLDFPSIEELKSLHYQNNNGKAYFDGLSSLFASGRILRFEDDETIERAFRIFKKRPNKYRTYYETDVGNKRVQLELIFDGLNAVQIFSHGGQEVYRENLEGEALDAVKLEARIEGPFLLVCEEPELISIDGYEFVENEKCIVLSIDKKCSYSFSRIWLSTEHYQEVKYERHSFDSDGNITTEEVFFKNYKKIQNLLLASRIDKNIDGKRRFSTFIDNFEINYGLFDSLFKVEGAE